MLLVKFFCAVQPLILKHLVLLRLKWNCVSSSDRKIITHPFLKTYLLTVLFVSENEFHETVTAVNQTGEQSLIYDCFGFFEVNYPFNGKTCITGPLIIFKKSFGSMNRKLFKSFFITLGIIYVMFFSDNISDENTR